MYLWYHTDFWNANDKFVVEKLSVNANYWENAIKDFANMHYRICCTVGGRLAVSENFTPRWFRSSSGNIEGNCGVITNVVVESSSNVSIYFMGKVKYYDCQIEYSQQL